MNSERHQSPKSRGNTITRISPAHFPDPSGPAKVNVWSVDREYRYTFFNENHQADMKELWGTEIYIGANLLELMSDLDYSKNVKAAYDSVFVGKSHRSIDKFTSPKGSFQFYENFGNPMYDEHNRITGAMFYSIDVTRRISLENDLKKTIALLQSIMNSPESLLILSIDIDYRYIFFNDAHRKAMLDVWQTEPKIGAYIFDLLPDPEYRKHVKENYDRAFQGEMFSAVSDFTDIHGNHRYFDNISAPIKDAEEKIIGITVFILDITDIVRAEQKVEESLEEKEILLKETHHRVKNNLQLITSMLNLQMAFISDEKALQALQDSQTRINTMAFIHRSLYQGNHLGKVRMQQYIDPLIGSVMDLYVQPDEEISIISDMGEIELDIDQAIPVGLIINELLTNSLKYAFSNREKGAISLQLDNTGPDNYHLRMEDNGIGLKNGFQIEKSDNLGMRLISALVGQLGGTLSMKNEGGVKTDITF